MSCIMYAYQMYVENVHTHVYTCMYMYVCLENVALLKKKEESNA